MSWVRGPRSRTRSPRPALERFDLATRKATELVSALDWFAVSGNGEWLVVRDGGELRVIPAQRKADPDGADTVRVDLARARFTADPVMQWRHAFTEAARFMGHDFWVEDMSGVDWGAVAEAYRPVLDRIGSSLDFADLLWEVVGELGTSHAYIRPPVTPGEHGHGRPGLLGADLSRDGDGTWRVTRVLPGESSDPRAGPRWKPRAPRCCRAMRCWPWTGARWTRWPARGRCWSAAPGSRSSSPWPAAAARPAGWRSSRWPASAAALPGLGGPPPPAGP